MTTGSGSFGVANAGLLAAALVSFALFAYSQLKVTAPLIQPDALRSAFLRSGLISIGLISTVIMTTLVVGPFYLSGALRLSPANVGLVMSVGPILAALVGVPSGHLVDRFGAGLTTLAGLAATTVGCLLIGLLATSLDAIGYIAAVGLVTTGYALFQAAANTAILKGVPADRRGVTSGLMGLARNLGLITGASIMGAVFAASSGGPGASSHTTAAATGTAFMVAAMLAALATGLALRTIAATKPVTLAEPPKP
jgi:MFS family permease